MSDLPDFVIDRHGGTGRTGLRRPAPDRRGRLRIRQRPEEVLYSELMCSAGIERAVRLANGRGLPADLDHWRDSLETWHAEQGRQRA